MYTNNLQTAEFEPKNDLDYRILGKLQKQQGNAEEAIKLYRQAIEINPKQPSWVYQHLGDLFYKQEKLVDAISVYQQATTIYPNDDRNYRVLAKLQRQQGNVEEAIEFYRQAIKINSKQPSWVYQHLGGIFSQIKKHDLAIEVYQQALESEPDNDSYYRILGQFHTQKGNVEEAISSYLNAINIKLAQPTELYRDMANVLRGYGQIDKAIEVYCQLIDLNNNLSDELQFYLGTVIFQLGIQQNQFSKAITFFESILHKQPNNPWNYYNLATIFARQDRYNKAISFLKKAITIKPNFAAAYLELGQIYEQKDDLDNLVNCCIKALEFQSNSRQTNKLIRLWFDRFRERFSLEHLKKLSKAYNQAIENIDKSSPCLILLYMNLAKILKQQKCFSEAIACYQNASYYKIQVSKPEYINKYWKSGTLQNPDFAIIGFMKCGTSSLYDYLIQHPQVLPAFEKEPHFLSRYMREIGETNVEKNWCLSEFNKKCYLSHFPPRPKSPKFVTGEASTSFFFTPNIEKLLVNSFPNIKLIVIMRNPVRRTISHYYHAVKYDGEIRSFEECIIKEMKKIEKINDPKKIIENAPLNRYLTHSMYVYFLEKWMNIFPKEQFLILENKNLNHNPHILINSVFDYLNLPQYNFINYHRKGKAYYPPIGDKMLTRLNNFFKPHNHKLEEYLGKKFNW